MPYDHEAREAFEQGRRLLHDRVIAPKSRSILNLGSPACREKPNIAILTRCGGVFGIGLALAALMPDDWLFGLTLLLGGVSALTFSNTTNSVLRLSTAPAMRGRIMAIRLAIALGSAPIGAPILG